MIYTENRCLVARCLCWDELRVVSDNKKDLATLMKSRGWRFNKERKQALCPDHDLLEEKK